MAVWEKVAEWPEDWMKHACCVNLHNVVTVARDDVGRRLARLPPARMEQVCTALGVALGCDG